MERKEPPEKKREKGTFELAFEKRTREFRPILTQFFLPSFKTTSIPQKEEKTITDEQKRELKRILPEEVTYIPIQNVFAPVASKKRKLEEEIAKESSDILLTKTSEVSKKRRLEPAIQPSEKTCFLSAATGTEFDVGKIKLLDTTIPIAETVPKSILEVFAYYQTNLWNRQDIASQIISALTAIPEKCSQQDVQKILQFRKKLGKGTYGVVCEVQFKEPDIMPWPLALKRMDISLKLTVQSKKDSFSSAFIESIWVKRLSKLTEIDRLGFFACPNFPIFYRQCFSTEQNKEFVDLFFELGTGDMFDLFANLSRNYNFAKEQKQKEIERKLLSSMFQVFCGLLWMGSNYDLVHNDLYMRNVIYNNVVPPVVYRYQLDEAHIYDINTYGYIAKIIDFSLSSSNNYPKEEEIITHQESIRWVEEKTIVDYTEDEIYEIGSSRGRHQHVLYYPFLNAYSRDVYAFLGQIYKTNSFPKNIRELAKLGIEYIHKEMEKKSLTPGERKTLQTQLRREEEKTMTFDEKRITKKKIKEMEDRIKHRVMLQNQLTELFEAEKMTKTAKTEEEKAILEKEIKKNKEKVIILMIRERLFRQSDLLTKFQKNLRKTTEKLARNKIKDEIQQLQEHILVIEGLEKDFEKSQKVTDESKLFILKQIEKRLSNIGKEIELLSQKIEEDKHKLNVLEYNVPKANKAFTTVTDLLNFTFYLFSDETLQSLHLPIDVFKQKNVEPSGTFILPMMID